jgi:hypothetical protein
MKSAKKSAKTKTKILKDTKQQVQAETKTDVTGSYGPVEVQPQQQIKPKATKKNETAKPKKAVPAKKK